MGGPHGLSAGLVAVVVTVVIANLGNNIVAPLMPAIKEEFGSTAAQVGLVASTFGLGRLLMDLPAGYLSDRMGYGRMFTLGILLSGVASALAVVSTSLEQLILFRAGMGFGSAILHTVALVLLVEMGGPNHRGRVLAFFTSAMLFGQALSPLIGGYLANLFSWRVAFVFCALTPLVSFPLNLFYTSKAAPAPGRGGHHGKAHAGGRRPRGAGDASAPPSDTNWPALVTVFLGTFANFFDRHGMRASLLPLYGGAVLGMDPGTIGMILTTGSLVTIFASLPSGAAADRGSKKRVLIPGLLVLVAGNACLLAGDSLLIFIVSTVLISMGVLANAMQGGLVADLVPERLVGNGMGMYRFTADLGLVVGPFVLGLVIDSHGYVAASMVGALMVLVAVVATVFLVPSRTAPPAAR